MPKPCENETNIIIQNEEMKEMLSFVTNVACGRIPSSYVEFGQMVWNVFNMGRKYEKEIYDKVKT